MIDQVSRGYSQNVIDGSTVVTSIWEMTDKHISEYGTITFSEITSY